MTARPAQAPRPVAGILWMLATGLCFVCVTAGVKLAGPEIPAAQSAFLRFALGLVFLIPVIPALIRLRPTATETKLIAGRGVIHTFGVICWFYAMTQIPIADVTAMNYLNPVYVTLGAALFLGEKLALRRMLAVVAALVGALIILRPGLREISPGHVAMLGTAVFFAGSYLIAKRLSGVMDAGVVVALLSLTVTVGLAPFAAAVWVPVGGREVAILFAVAAFATAGHYTMTRAFAVAPVAVTQPVTFLQLIWATTLGAVAFGEPVDVWVVVGGAVIVASVSFIAWREAVLRRRHVTPVPEATKV